MTSPLRPPAAHRSALRRAGDLLARRIREPAFWRIQAMVVVITAAHVGLEADLVTVDFLDRLPQALQHVPVALYVIPVAYGGLVYGLEGGVLTALWISLLAGINIPLWHWHDFEWVTEIVLMLVVVGVGIATSVPVERERRQRTRAEATSRRLGILNEMAHAALLDWGPEQIAESALLRLVAVPDIESAGIGLKKRDAGTPVVLSTHSDDPRVAASLKILLESPEVEGLSSSDLEGEVLSVPLTTEYLVGALCVVLRPDRSLTAGEMDFLRAIGSQLAVGIENGLLRQQERVALESYVHLVTRAQEEERRHIARELHDSAVQQLALLARSIDEIDEESSPARDLAVDRLRGLATSTLEELRRFSRDLRPFLLDDLGLVPALQWLITEAEDRTGIPTDLTVTGDVRRHPTEVEVALYRITQEALRNVERHAGAARSAVEVRFEPERIVISVRDDGIGFAVPADPGVLVSSGKLGLMGMHERAQLAGGHLTLESSPGGGAVVTIAVPTPPP